MGMQERTDSARTTIPQNTLDGSPSDTLDLDDPDTPVEGAGGPADGSAQPHTTDPPPPTER